MGEKSEVEVSVKRTFELGIDWEAKDLKKQTILKTEGLCVIGACFVCVSGN